jgi:hypothetical protein
MYSEPTTSDIDERFPASMRRRNGEHSVRFIFFLFRPMSGDITGHRHTEITLFNVGLSETVHEYCSNSFCGVFWTYCEHLYHF